MTRTDRVSGTYNATARLRALLVLTDLEITRFRRSRLVITAVSQPNHTSSLPNKPSHLRLQDGKIPLMQGTTACRPDDDSAQQVADLPDEVD